MISRPNLNLFSKALTQITSLLLLFEIIIHVDKSYEPFFILLTHDGHIGRSTGNSNPVITFSTGGVKG